MDVAILPRIHACNLTPNRIFEKRISILALAVFASSGLIICFLGYAFHQTYCTKPSRPSKPPGTKLDTIRNQLLHPRDDTAKLRREHLEKLYRKDDHTKLTSEEAVEISKAYKVNGYVASNQEATDITVLVGEGIQISAQRSVLASNSDYMKRMLQYVEDKINPRPPDNTPEEDLELSCEFLAGTIRKFYYPKQLLNMAQHAYFLESKTLMQFALGYAASNKNFYIELSIIIELLRLWKEHSKEYPVDGNILCRLLNRFNYPLSQQIIIQNADVFLPLAKACNYNQIVKTIAKTEATKAMKSGIFTDYRKNQKECDRVIEIAYSDLIHELSSVHPLEALVIRPIPYANPSKSLFTRAPPRGKPFDFLATRAILRAAQRDKPKDKYDAKIDLLYLCPFYNVLGRATKGDIDSCTASERYSVRLSYIPENHRDTLQYAVNVSSLFLDYCNKNVYKIRRLFQNRKEHGTRDELLLNLMTPNPHFPILDARYLPLILEHFGPDLSDYPNHVAFILSLKDGAEKYNVFPDGPPPYVQAIWYPSFPDDTPK